MKIKLTKSKLSLIKMISLSNFLSDLPRPSLSFQVFSGVLYKVKQLHRTKCPIRPELIPTSSILLPPEWDASKSQGYTGTELISPVPIEIVGLAQEHKGPGRTRIQTARSGDERTKP